MVDKQKRNTVKTITATLVGAAVAGTSAVASTTVIPGSAVPVEQETGLELAHIEVFTRVSSNTNDIEVVITNAGSTDTLITQITPSQTTTKRGTFDFSSLLSNGELQLSAGESVSVPMIARPVVLDASTTATERAQSLSAALRKSFSVITENQSFARVAISENVRIV